MFPLTAVFLSMRSAQELALRDMDSDAPTPDNYDELCERMDEYLGEFEEHGTDNITVEM